MAAPRQHEEDDIDDLDDVLDQFSPSSKAASSSKPTGSADAAKTAHTPSSKDTAAASTASAGQSSASQDEDGDEVQMPPGFDDALSKQFAAELAKGMDEMFGKGAGAASGSGSGGGAAASNKEGGSAGDSQPEMSEEEMMRQFEKIMAEMGLGDGSANPAAATAGAAGGSSASTSGSAGGPQQPADFQDAIKSTMSRLRQSSAASGSAGGADAFGDFSEEDMAKLLSSLGENGELPEGEEGMAQMLEKMMGELMSKEVLHEPLKELRDKYPPYFKSPPAGVSQEDLARYHEQYRCVAEVVDIFDDPEYDNGSENKKKELKSRVTELMTAMQDAGAPPEEVVGEMPEGLENIPGLGGGAGGPGGEDCVVM